MINYNCISRPKKGIMSFIDFWSLFYLLMVYIFTVICDQLNIYIFVLYLICALPFVNHLDKFVCICFILSTMAYYFLGGDEGIWSLYTIFAGLMVLQIFAKPQKRWALNSCCGFILMVAAVILSYADSKFGYAKGMLAMIYNLAIAALIAMTVQVNQDTLTSFLPRIASFQLAIYVIILLISGSYDGYGFSISKSVNHNTFGTSVSVLSIILFVTIIFFQRDSGIYKFFWIVSVVLTLISGSRNALLAMILTSLAIYIVFQKHQGKAISKGVKLLLIGCVFIFIGVFLLTALGVDLTRYNYIELLKTGGSNRTIIWKTLSPIIWKEHKWFGYGPGHFCSEQMIMTFLNVDYKHTHNTIFEVWGEMGLFGLGCFLLLTFSAFKKSYLYIMKREKNGYLLMGFLFIEFFLLGIGESFLANIELWIIIGLLLGYPQVKNKLN